ncbi:hypothetical protein ACFWE3_08380 [Mycobacteriaceae bacterium NPDC060252]
MSTNTCPTCSGPTELIEQDRFEGGFPDAPTTVQVKVPVCKQGCRPIRLRNASHDGRPLHHVSACADPRIEGTVAFYQQLHDYIVTTRGERRRIWIRGIASPVEPAVNFVYLRQYGVSYVVDE